jgi:hypothetical protein
MNMFSAVRAYFNKAQRLNAEIAMRQGKWRFIWIQGVLGHVGIGVVVAILLGFQPHPVPWSKLFNLTVVLSIALVLGIWGYLRAHWQWRAYERLVKGRIS